MELKILINSMNVKPMLIAITQFKHKSKTDAQINEFNLPGYKIVSNDINSTGRGVLLYVNSNLKFKQINLDNDCQEFVAIEIEGVSNAKYQWPMFTELLRAPVKMTKNYLT